MFGEREMNKRNPSRHIGSKGSGNMPSVDIHEDGDLRPKTQWKSGTVMSVRHPNFHGNTVVSMRIRLDDSSEVIEILTYGVEQEGGMHELGDLLHAEKGDEVSFKECIESGDLLDFKVCRLEPKPKRPAK
jgi:hypothetical protein